MTYRVVWRLIGRAARLLDEGEIDDDYLTYAAAVAAVSELLSVYPDATRAGDGTHWRARRSADADLELEVWIHRLDPAGAEVPATLAQEH